MSNSFTEIDPQPLLLTEREVALALKMSLATVRRWRTAGTGPRWFKVGAAVRYRRADLNIYVESLAGDRGAERIG